MCAMIPGEDIVNPFYCAAFDAGGCYLFLKEPLKIYKGRPNRDFPSPKL